MKPVVIAFHDRALSVEAAPSIAPDLAAFFALCAPDTAPASVEKAAVLEESPGRYTLALDGKPPVSDISRGEVVHRLAAALGRDAFFDGPGVLLAAGAVGWGDKSILIVGEDGAGKSSLVAWFVENGFAYLADDSVLLLDDGEIVGFPEPIAFRAETLAHIAALPGFHDVASTRAAERLLLRPDPTWLAVDRRARCGLVIEVRFEAGAELHVDPLPAAHATLRVLEASRRVVIPTQAEYAPVAALGEAVPALRLVYGGYAQLVGVLDFLARAAVEMASAPPEFAAFLSGLPRPAAAVTTAAAPKTYPIPARSDRRFSPRLTIGMATYDDYDGVYFSIQAIRMYHPEILDQVEFVLIDNHPDGVCAEPLKALENAVPNLRYIPFLATGGTAASRNLIFAEGGGEFALCMDCHVFIVPGALRRLLAYFADHPDTGDLLQGPLVGDDLGTLSTQFNPLWRAGMYGVWGHDPAGDDPDGPPFDIPMQGLGVFACRRAAWLGFNPLFSGFGGEEGYIHEKFRQAGHRALCLPFLRWMHRFQRPLGAPYRNTWEDRCRNYMIGFRELGLPTQEMEAHFAELLGADNAARIFDAVKAELDRV